MFPTFDQTKACDPPEVRIEAGRGVMVVSS